MKTSPERLKALRQLTYKEYLQTIEWRVRRGLALKRAGYCCEQPKCGRRTQLQVHHRTYDHIGEELAEELSVVCEPCHDRYHATQPAHLRASVYNALVHEVLKAEAFVSLADLTEEVKVRCAKLKFQYSSDDVNHAIDAVLRMTKTSFTPFRVDLMVPPAAIPPFSQSEAVAFLEKVGLRPLIKEMPGERPMSPNIAERYIGQQFLRQQAARQESVYEPDEENDR